MLRALSYSLILQLVVSPWTRSLVLKLEEGAWENHLSAIVTYGAVVLVIVPITLGLALNGLLLGVERSGRNLRWWHYALGARDARESWDYVFQRIREGHWIILKVKDGPAIAGELGQGSWASQSPAQGGHDLWLQEIWTVDDFGVPEARIEPAQGMWIARSEIQALFVLNPPSG